MQAFSFWGFARGSAAGVQDAPGIPDKPCRFFAFWAEFAAFALLLSFALLRFVISSFAYTRKG
jgi:hypothetical protein